MARRIVGRETVDYVANVNKHYVAYKLSLAALSDRMRSREAIEGGSGTGAALGILEHFRPTPRE